MFFCFFIVFCFFFIFVVVVYFLLSNRPPACPSIRTLSLTLALQSHTTLGCSSIPRPCLLHPPHTKVTSDSSPPTQADAAAAAMKVILSINAGSSSVKISAYVADKKSEPRQIAELEVSGLTAPPARLKYSRYGQPVALDDAASAAAAAVGSQDDAFRLLLDTLVGDEQLLEIDSRSKIAVACHRIVHGGDYDDSKLINSETYHHLEELSDLAPLHNGPALDIVSFCAKQLPEAANVACFDTQFHASMPAHIVTYAINPEVARKNHLRKYGFHGLSYAFITRSVAGFLSKDPSQVNLIALHLGSGASVCAIKAGQSLDTSMGLTPLAGLPGATRSGSVDPRCVLWPRLTVFSVISCSCCPLSLLSLPPFGARGCRRMSC